MYLFIFEFISLLIFSTKRPVSEIGMSRLGGGGKAVVVRVPSNIVNEAL